MALLQTGSLLRYVVVVVSSGTTISTNATHLQPLAKFEEYPIIMGVAVMKVDCQISLRMRICPSSNPFMGIKLFDNCFAKIKQDPPIIMRPPIPLPVPHQV